MLEIYTTCAQYSDLANDTHNNIYQTCANIHITVEFKNKKMTRWVQYTSPVT